MATHLLPHLCRFSLSLYFHICLFLWTTILFLDLPMSPTCRLTDSTYNCKSSYCSTVYTLGLCAAPGVLQNFWKCLTHKHLWHFTPVALQSSLAKPWQWPHRLHNSPLNLISGGFQYFPPIFPTLEFHGCFFTAFPETLELAPFPLLTCSSSLSVLSCSLQTFMTCSSVRVQFTSDILGEDCEHYLVPHHLIYIRKFTLSRCSLTS